MELKVQTESETHKHTGTSVDKVVAAAGYVPGNIVLCTYRANRIKGDMTLLELREWMPGWYERIEKFEGEDFPVVNIEEEKQRQWQTKQQKAV